MEPPSVPLYRGLIPWQGLLLTASLLTSWNPPTTAQLTVQSMPPSAAEGTDVLLHVHNLTESPLGYYWDKGDRVASTNRILSYVVATEAITPGPTYSNRETIYPNGSLLLQNVTQNDTGYYTIQVLSQTLQSEEATGQLRVYPKLPKPSIASTNSNPVEDKDSVSLTCEPETPDTTYLWWINGQSLRISDRLVMSRDNRTLTLQNITRNDIGPYECGNWNPVSSNRSDPFTLNVLYGPNAPTISPPESYYRPGANLTLSCHADSNPPAQYSWLINERPQQATRELFIASVTVNNSGSYACVAQNSATGCNGTTVKNITVSEELPRPFITSNNSNPVENKDSVALTCEPAAQDVTYLWWLNNQSLPVSPRLQLSPDNRTLTLFDVTRDDSGPFVCEIQTPESSNHSDPFTLNVLYGPDDPTISPLESSYSSGANLNLSCHADSNPPAQYSWLINGSSQQAMQDLFIPGITAKDSGSYTCHAHNSATGLSKTRVMNIIVSDAPVKESPPGLSAGAIVGIVIGVLAGVALIAALAYFLSSTSRRSMKLPILL
ncbi:carcinoembryonic antigen-related cell adhesion molecule 6-like isoform X2 [Nycticebus coucang]|uniref:carcinoembryonic antigen-related cell adhesion molecule 6-like isoform X2 n=1 Tax=Nycticebus coucang TaxID=9470 RepID=UPI00234DC2EC|nr:carcinoembryonic antigen-related cell adhesion molecule 6-like isoform X2 [Nycticebus coucang]